jgi:hypothetical protein
MQYRIRKDIWDKLEVVRAITALIYAMDITVDYKLLENLDADTKALFEPVPEKDTSL